MSAAEKAAARQRIAAGAPRIRSSARTALIQESVTFQRLGLVRNRTKQHRFGVEQRAAAGRKSDAPSASPDGDADPTLRSQLHAGYGDLDDHADPRAAAPGRGAVEDRAAHRRRAVQDLRIHPQRVRRRRQAYVVYPVIDESERPI